MYSLTFLTIMINVINILLEPVLVCPMERYILVPINFDLPFLNVSRFLKNSIYINIYIYIYIFIIPFLSISEFLKNSIYIYLIIFRKKKI